MRVKEGDRKEIFYSNYYRFMDSLFYKCIDFLFASIHKDKISKGSLEKLGEDIILKIIQRLEWRGQLELKTLELFQDHYISELSLSLTSASSEKQRIRVTDEWIQHIVRYHPQIRKLDLANAFRITNDSVDSIIRSTCRIMITLRLPVATRFYWRSCIQ